MLEIRNSRKQRLKPSKREAGIGKSRNSRKQRSKPSKREAGMTKQEAAGADNKKQWEAQSTKYKSGGKMLEIRNSRKQRSKPSKREARSREDNKMQREMGRKQQREA